MQWHRNDAIAGHLNDIFSLYTGRKKQSGLRASSCAGLSSFDV